MNAIFTRLNLFLQHRYVKRVIGPIGLLLIAYASQLFLPQPSRESFSQHIATSIAADVCIPNELATTTAQVTHVVDGDTIDIIFNCKKERVRLIGINTPETVDPRRPVQCFGKEASDKTKSLLSGATVRIETDPTQNERDKYGRLLAYIFLDDVNINKKLIEDGYAYEYTYGKAYKYKKEFKAVQTDAKEQKRGLWADGVCGTNSNFATSSDFKTKTK